jgi:hypothetical protein
MATATCSGPSQIIGGASDASEDAECEVAVTENMDVEATVEEPQVHASEATVAPHMRDAETNKALPPRASEVIVVPQMRDTEDGKELRVHTAVKIEPSGQVPVCYTVRKTESPSSNISEEGEISETLTGTTPVKYLLGIEEIGKESSGYVSQESVLMTKLLEKGMSYPEFRNDLDTLKCLVRSQFETENVSSAWRQWKAEYRLWERHCKSLFSNNSMKLTCSSQRGIFPWKGTNSDH